VVLDRDPYATDLHELHRIRVDQTFSDGRLVFVRQGREAR